MRLDPKVVRYAPPFLGLGRGLRFVGRENNIQLTETALVFEGNLLKLSLLGFELLFRRALAEWTAVTVPYSRIVTARKTDWPALRVLAAVATALATVSLAAAVATTPDVFTLVMPAVLLVLSVYVLLRVGGVYRVTYRHKDGKRRTVRFRIKSKKAAREFDRRLRQYRSAATGGQR